MHVTYIKDSQAVQTQSELYGVMADALRECGRLVQEAKSRLDSIDQHAHEEIDRSSKKQGRLVRSARGTRSHLSIITRARNEAIAVVTDAVRSIAQQAVKIVSADAPRVPAGAQHRRSGRPTNANLGWCPVEAGAASDCQAVSAANLWQPPPTDIKKRPAADAGRGANEPRPPQRLRMETEPEKPLGSPGAPSRPRQVRQQPDLETEGPLPERTSTPRSIDLPSNFQPHSPTPAVSAPISPVSGMSGTGGSAFRPAGMPSMPSTPSMPATPTTPAASLPTPTSAAQDLSQGFTKGLASGAGNPLPPAVPQAPTPPPAVTDVKPASIPASAPPPAAPSTPIVSHTPPPAPAASQAALPGRCSPRRPRRTSPHSAPTCHGRR